MRMGLSSGMPTEDAIELAGNVLSDIPAAKKRCDEAMDMVESDMLLVVVDVNNMRLTEAPELFDRCDRVIVIDHHRKTAEFEREPTLTYIETGAAAASELVAEMLEQSLPAGLLTPAEANMMMAGITLDTKQFTRNTGTRTFGVAQFLRGVGAEPGKAQELFKSDVEELIKEGKKPHAILGFGSSDEVFYKEEFEKLGVPVTVTTADGSEGIKGFVTDAMDSVNYTYFYTCGPEPMLKAVYAKSTTGGQFSFEERMGCGFGACMGCSCKTLTGNKRICREGPVLQKEEILWQ